MQDENQKSNRLNIGVTKKVSITLQEEVWSYLRRIADTETNGNLSKVLREIVYTHYIKQLEKDMGKRVIPNGVDISDM